MQQGVQRFRGSAALPDDKKIPGRFVIRKWDRRDTGRGKTLEAGRDQGDGTFASDQALILGLFTRVAALGLAVNMIGYASLSAVRKNRFPSPSSQKS